jgi:4-hydroxy-tetrahydrodipicolinate synthase
MATRPGNLFRGLSAFPLTPADPGGTVDADALGRLVERLAESGVASIGVLGSTGGFMYLERTQRRRAVAAAAEAANGRVPVVAGVGALRTDEAILLARDAEAAGADALLLAPVSYIPLKDDEVFEHVASVAGATGLPVCLYNNPTTTHFTFSRDLLARLADVPRVAGAKMPMPADGDVASELAELDRRTGGRIAIGYSGDPGLVQAGLGGAGGFYSALAGTLPREVKALFDAAASGDATRACALDMKFQPMWALFRAHGGFRVIPEIARTLGLADTLPPRPVLPLPAMAQGDLRAALEALHGV